ncbi:oxygen-independent coproporphyrinogen III oxidase [Chromobacterium amazonense]|uniref:oxygen-independent coproporphyrinogen III oxidase n=1 Tax=Chromobacterium amazonense TaxID=1382803 RepID=UPI0005827468|nr:oxygen-independent coproporphyrinogen III oxidase [Chromobacterium amazonense]KIA81020.1 coproporphyrinogen III oxidase [Chromobacterium piscinae]MBM2884855.1 oxygen-independent coproporphyrinogen III oxidase [Chromobacterium amazonense]MDE1714801.1 oxygen-independent coproporphyrinogen III oxidase [Chromobacterium amazonense]
MKTTHPYSPAHFEFDRELIERLDGSGPRYTSYPTADRFTSNFSESDYLLRLKQRRIGANRKPLSLYVHIPFCNTVCFYCACNKIITKDKSKADIYLDYLEKEIRLVAEQLGCREKVIQLHFGGGTPTFLSDAQLQRLMGMLSTHFEFMPDGEYSIEIDPRKVSRETMRKLAQYGFNRISVGVQDFEPAVQKAVNRVQSEEETRAVIDAGRAAGIQSVSLDLIYGLPLQTRESMLRTLETALALDPDRLALYNYAHLPTVFMPQRRIHEADLPPAGVKLDILQDAVKMLTNAGYVFIGMDHFAKPDDELAVALRQGRLQRNFQGYSTHADCDMLGFGVSSIGKIGACYTQNDKTLEGYYAALDQKKLPVVRGLTLDNDDVLRRTIIQGLMCRFSLSVEAIEEIYGINFAQYFTEEMPQIRVFQQQGLLSFDGDFLMVEPKGRFLIRNIAMIFDRHLRERQTHARYSKTI